MALCVKAFLHESLGYAASCSGSVRQVPIGLDIPEFLPRELWMYYQYGSDDGDDPTRAEWYDELTSDGFSVDEVGQISGWVGCRLLIVFTVRFVDT